MCLSNFFTLNMLNWYWMTKTQTFSIPQYLVIFLQYVRGELHAVLTPYFTQCIHHQNRRKFLCLQNCCVECSSVGSISANASNSSPVSVDKELSRRSRQCGWHRYRHSPVCSTVSFYAAVMHTHVHTNFITTISAIVCALTARHTYRRRSWFRVERILFWLECQGIVEELCFCNETVMNCICNWQ